MALRDAIQQPANKLDQHKLRQHAAYTDLMVIRDGTLPIPGAVGGPIAADHPHDRIAVAIPGNGAGTRWRTWRATEGPAGTWTWNLIEAF